MSGILKMFAVRDNAVNAFARPWFARTTEEAIRSFKLECQSEKSPMFMSPHDYVLFELGSYEEDKAHFNLLVAPQKLCVAAEFAINPANEPVVKLPKKR